jgi:hypothetical protein
MVNYGITDQISPSGHWAAHSLALIAYACQIPDVVLQALVIPFHILRLGLWRRNDDHTFDSLGVQGYCKRQTRCGGPVELVSRLISRFRPRDVAKKVRGIARNHDRR